MPPKASNNMFVYEEESAEGSCSSLILQEEERRSVHFASGVMTCLIEGLDQYTQEEIETCWYTEEEKYMSQESRNKVIARMEEGKLEKLNSPYRGLETLTERGMSRMHQQIYAVVDVVMDEQEVQWSNRTSDVEKIAYLSQEISSSSQVVARRTAIQDERDVIEMLREEKMESESSSSSATKSSKTKNNVFSFGRSIMAKRNKLRGSSSSKKNKKASSFCDPPGNTLMVVTARQ